MNILLTTDAFPPGSGGSGRSTAMLASALARRGHRVRVVVARTKGKLKGQSEWAGVPVSEIEIPEHRTGSRARERAYAKGLEQALGEEAWDLVHAQHWLSAAATHEACPRLPMVVTVRDYWPVCIWSTMLSGDEECPGCSYGRRVVCVGRRKPWLWPLAPALPPLVGKELGRRKQLLENAKAVIAVSHHVAKTLPTTPTHVIPNMLGEIQVPGTCSKNVPERYVFFVGKLELNKAPDRLLPILDEAKTDLPLLVAGTGRLAGELRREAKRRGRHVRLLGWVDEEEVLTLMHQAEAVLFPSRWQEPLARVLIDGLGIGATLLVEPTGGSAEIVVHEESGLLGEGVRGLGRALARVLDDDALADRLREGARARARACFSEAVVTPQLESMYRSVVS